VGLRPVAVPGGGLGGDRPMTAGRAGPAVGSGSASHYNTAAVVDNETCIMQPEGEQPCETPS
jgi:hypothetical protein